MAKTVLRAGILALALATSALAQKPYVESGDDLDTSQAKLAMNRATKDIMDGSQMERVAVKSKQAPLLDTFRGTKSKVNGDGIWKERGVATLWYDSEGKLFTIEVENNEAQNLE